MALTNDEEVIVKKLALEKKVTDAKAEINKTALVLIKQHQDQIKTIDEQRLSNLASQDALLEGK